MQGMFRRFNARELVVDKGEKESRGNNFSLKFHFALVEEHPLDIHAAIRIIANFFALDVSHNKPREYVFSVTLTRYEAGQWTTNEKNIYFLFFFFFSRPCTRSFSRIFRGSLLDARWKIYAVIETARSRIVSRIRGGFSAREGRALCNFSRIYRWN